MRIIPLSDAEIEELRRLDLDIEDFERRTKSAKIAKRELLVRVAKLKGPDDSWRLSDDGKFIAAGGPGGEWHRG